MAKRKARPGGRKTKPGKKRVASGTRISAKRRTSGKRAPAKAVRRLKSKARPARRPARRAAPADLPAKKPRLDRERRTLIDDVPTPPSSLNMDRRGSAARTGRAEMSEARREHAGMLDVAGSDPDVDIENAYFSGDEAPGGDNPTPDQDIVDEIGRAVGLEYQDVEELDTDKVAERDKHRWELDPASSDDYKDRK